MKKALLFLNLLIVSSTPNIFGAAGYWDSEDMEKPLVLTNRTNKKFFLLPQFYKTKDGKDVWDSAYTADSTDKKTEMLPGSSIEIQGDPIKKLDTFRVGDEDDPRFLYVESDKKVIAIPFDWQGKLEKLGDDQNLLDPTPWTYAGFEYPKALSIVETGDQEKPFLVKLDGELTQEERKWAPTKKKSLFSKIKDKMTF